MDNTGFIDTITSFDSPTIIGIENLNTSNVTNMLGVFSENTSFNQDLSWNTIKVTTMTDMFNGATSFNQSSIGRFNYSSIISIDNFINDTAYTNNEINNILTALSINTSLINNVSLSKLVTETVSSIVKLTFIFDISSTIWNSSNSNGIKIPLINTGNSFKRVNTDISNNNGTTTVSCSWIVYDISSNMDGLSFNINDISYGNHPSINIRQFEGIPLRNMTSSSNASFTNFKGKITAPDSPTIPNTSLAYCFQDSSCTNFGNISNWDISNVTILDNMFDGASINDASLGHWNYSKITSMTNFIKNSSFDLNNIFTFFNNLSTNINIININSKNLGDIPAYRPSEMNSLNSTLQTKNITFTSNTIYSDIMSKTYDYLMNTLLYTSSILRKKGYFTSELKSLGYSVSELVNAGYESSDFKQGQYTVYDLFFMYLNNGGSKITIPVIELP